MGGPETGLEGQPVVFVVLLLKVGWNTPHGPWNDDQRFALLSEGWGDIVKHQEARSSALFQHYSADIFADTGGTSELIIGEGGGGGGAPTSLCGSTCWPIRRS